MVNCGKGMKKAGRSRRADGGPNGILVTLSAAHFLGPVGTKLIFGFAERTLGCGVPITPRLSQKLQQTLGGQEGAEFVNWMHEMDARVSDVATHGDLAQLRADLRADFAEMRQEMQVGFAALETRFERRISDLIKWSFVFWVGAVGAIAMLARVLP
jgi:hypothetical protein